MGESRSVVSAVFNWFLTDSGRPRIREEVTGGGFRCGMRGAGFEGGVGI